MAPLPKRSIVKIYNKGSSTLQITGLSISGPDHGMFVITDNIALPRNIAAGKSISIHVAFAGSPKKDFGIKTAQLNIASNDPVHPTAVVRLRGLSTKGEGGLLEPSLQQILDLYQIPDNVGDSDSSTTLLDIPPKTPNDEVTIQRLVKATSGDVTVEPIGVFANATNPALIFGYYEAGSPQNQTDLFRVANSGAERQPALQRLHRFRSGDRHLWPLLDLADLHQQDHRQLHAHGLTAKTRSTPGNRSRPIVARCASIR